MPRKNSRVQHEANLSLARMQLGRAFSPSGPISRLDLFAGRLKQIDQVISAVSQSGQHVIVFGERGVGKTSLATVIHEIWTEVTKDADGVLAPRINCDSSDTFDTIWKRVGEEIALLLRKKQGGNWTDSELLNDALHEISYNAKPSNVRRFLGLLDQTFIIIIDEFDTVQDDASRKMMAETIKTLSDQLVPTTCPINKPGADVA